MEPDRLNNVDLSEIPHMPTNHMVHIRMTALTVSDTDNNQPQSVKHKAFIILTNLIYGCLRSIISFSWENPQEEFQDGEVVKVNNKVSNLHLVIRDMIINVPYSQQIHFPKLIST